MLHRGRMLFECSIILLSAVYQTRQALLLQCFKSSMNWIFPKKESITSHLAKTHVLGILRKCDKKFQSNAHCSVRNLIKDIKISALSFISMYYFSLARDVDE